MKEKEVIEILGKPDYESKKFYFEHNFARFNKKISYDWDNTPIWTIFFKRNKILGIKFSLFIKDLK